MATEAPFIALLWLEGQSVIISQQIRAIIDLISKNTNHMGFWRCHATLT
jgi:hypothetical protein